MRPIQNRHKDELAKLLETQETARRSPDPVAQPPAQANPTAKPRTQVEAELLATAKAQRVAMGMSDDDDDDDDDDNEEFLGGYTTKSTFMDYKTDEKIYPNPIGLGIFGGCMVSDYWKQITLVLCILVLLYIIYLIKINENKKLAEYINYTDYPVEYQSDSPPKYISKYRPKYNPSYNSNYSPII